MSNYVYVSISVVFLLTKKLFEEFILNDIGLLHINVQAYSLDYYSILYELVSAVYFL